MANKPWTKMPKRGGKKDNNKLSGLPPDEHWRKINMDGNKMKEPLRKKK